MASGKSHTGRQLATRLNRPFIDLDEHLEAHTGRTITTLFEYYGEPTFRDLETQALRRLADSPAVIATGGGAPIFHGNMEWMNARGLTLFLDPTVDVLLHRLEAGRAHRPLLAGAGDLRRSVTAKLAERRPVYEQATHRFTYDAPESPVAADLYTYLEEHHPDIILSPARNVERK